MVIRSLRGWPGHDWVTDVAQSGIPEVRDQSTGRLLTQDPTGIARLRGRLAGLHDLAVGFMGLLEEWGAGLNQLIVSVDEYLAREGGGV